MPRAMKDMRDVPLNPFEALKLYYIGRGYIPRYFRSSAGGGREDSKPPEPKAEQTGRRPDRLSKMDETYSEDVADGKSDKTINESDDDKKLKSEAEGSKTAKGPETLTENTEKSQHVLYEATTVFPFTLVPDTITLDREKLTIANRVFWRMADITSVPVGEIMSAEATVGPFFGSLHMTFRFFANNERTISFLPRQATLEMQRLIHGYIIAHRREIDVSNVSKEKLVRLLTELGQGASD
jgi:hypothetical protein